jgi:hypothetical protein
MMNMAEAGTILFKEFDRVIEWREELVKNGEFLKSLRVDELLKMSSMPPVLDALTTHRQEFVLTVQKPFEGGTAR